MYTIHSLISGLEALLRASCPNAVLAMSLRHPYKAGKSSWDKGFYMNVILLKLSTQHNSLTIREDGIRITWLKLNNKIYIIFFIKNFNKFYSIFKNLINLFQHDFLISQQKWLYIKRKKSLSSAMTTKQWKFSTLYWHYCFLCWITKIEKCYMKNN